MVQLYLFVFWCDQISSISWENLVQRAPGHTKSGRELLTLKAQCFNARLCFNCMSGVCEPDCCTSHSWCGPACSESTNQKQTVPKRPKNLFINLPGCLKLFWSVLNHTLPRTESSFSFRRAPDFATSLFPSASSARPLEQQMTSLCVNFAWGQLWRENSMGGGDALGIDRGSDSHWMPPCVCVPVSSTAMQHPLTHTMRHQLPHPSSVLQWRQAIWHWAKPTLRHELTRAQRTHATHPVWIGPWVCTYTGVKCMHLFMAYSPRSFRPVGWRDACRWHTRHSETHSATSELSCTWSRDWNSYQTALSEEKKIWGQKLARVW